MPFVENDNVTFVYKEITVFFVGLFMEEMSNVICVDEETCDVICPLQKMTLCNILVLSENRC